MSSEQKNQQSPQHQTSNPQQNERNRQEAPEQQRPSHMNQGNPGFRPNTEKENKNPSSQQNQKDEHSRKAS